MATALKHKQRSQRSYQSNHKAMGNMAIVFTQKSNEKAVQKQTRGSALERIKQLLHMGQKGDR